MTVSSLANRIDYLGTASVGPFSYPFRIMGADDLTVTRTTDTGIETTLLFPMDYTISGIGERDGGSVTLVALLPVGYSLTIRRVLSLLQSTELRNQGTYFPADVEDMTDRSVMMAQQLSEVDSRNMSLPVSSNPAIVSARFPTPQANRAIFWNANQTALEARLLDNSDNVALPGNSRTITTLTEYLANNAVFNVKDYGAIGDGIHDDTANIQNCFNAAPAGAVVRIPTGTYRITAAVNQCLLIDHPLTILGDGMDKSILVVASGTPNTVDAIRLLGGYGAGQMISNYCGFFQIAPESGNPGRSCINVDVTPGAIAYAVFDYLRLGALSSYSFLCTNPAPRLDGFFTSTIQDCLIAGGINLENAGDSIHLYRNTIFSLAGNANQLGIRVNLIAGGAGGSPQGFELIGGNVTCAGGIDYFCGNAGVIADLNMECPLPSTNSVGAMINIEGTVANPVYGLTVQNCNMGAGNTNVSTIMQVNYAYGTKFSHNLIGPPIPPRLAYTITANARGTLIADETWGLSATLPETAILDEGFGTVIRLSTALATGTYNQRAYYLAHKAALSNAQFIEMGTDQYADSIVFGVLRNDPKAPLGALVSAAGVLSVGAYRYRVSYVKPSSEQAAGSVSALTFISTPGTIGKIQLSGIAIDTDVADIATARKIWRTQANGSTFFLLATLADNVTTTYLDNTADAALVTAYVRSPSTRPSAGETFGDAASKGLLRVFGSGNIRFGDGTDVGTPVQFNDFAFFVTGAAFGQSLSLNAGAFVNVKNAANTESFSAFGSNPADDTINIGSFSVPLNGTDQRILLFKYNGTEKARIDAAGLRVTTAFACNGKAPQVSASLGAALAAYGAGANGLANAGDMQALVNKVKAVVTALIANGIAIEP